jgi:phytoene dehydrogenase-like protein
MNSTNTSSTYDVIVVGGGHNGLMAAAYLGRAGRRVAVVEARERLGGPCGTYEFMPGYRCGFANSPGSFEPRFVAELELERFGLRFATPALTVIHPFASSTFIGWRDRAVLAEQFDRFSPGEADRYFGLIAKLEELGRHLGVSMYEPSPDIGQIAANVPADQRDLFNRVFFGSMTQLLDEHLRSPEAKALLAIVGMATNLTPPSAPGSAIGLMLRPISLASSPPLLDDDPRRAPLRGSTGLPIGGMGAIVDALEACCRHHGVDIMVGAPVSKVTYRDGRATGVVTRPGRELRASKVLSAINPKVLFGELVDDAAVGGEIRKDMSAAVMRGSAFKLALALDGLPTFRNLPKQIDQRDAAAIQFRIAPSLDYIERAIGDSLAGVPSREPLMWGLIPSLTSPSLAPEGRHLLSVNVWHAPHELREGSWAEAGPAFADRCVDVLAESIPNLKSIIVDRSFMDPVAIEAELGLPQSTITHGEMMPGALFGARPHAQAHDYRTPLRGLYLTGGGTWPGGYVTGIPGFNAARAILSDIRNTHH